MEIFTGSYSHVQLKEFKTFGINKGSISVSLKPLIIKRANEKNLKYLSDVLTDTENHNYLI